MPANQQPGDRYVQQPDGHGETGDELYCPLAPERVCAADCVAFDVQGTQADGRTTCIAVNALKQIAAAAVAMARQGGAERPRSSAADIPPPEVKT